MKYNIQSILDSIEHDNKQAILDGGYESTADYILTEYNNADPNSAWVDYFDEEPTADEIEDFKAYVRDNYSSLPHREYYLLYIVQNRKSAYTTDDIEQGGWCNINPDDFSIQDEEDAERIRQELQRYCDEKGYIYYHIGIEKCEGIN